MALGGGAALRQFIRVDELDMIGGLVRVIQGIVPFALADGAGLITEFNRVGLRRADFPGDHQADVREAYQTLFGQGLPFREALKRLARVGKTPPGKRPRHFLRAQSLRGSDGKSTVQSTQTQADRDKQGRIGNKRGGL